MLNTSSMVVRLAMLIIVNDTGCYCFKSNKGEMVAIIFRKARRRSAMETHN